MKKDLETMTANRSLIIWMDAFKVTLKTKANYKRRLNELETWDKCNGHESERQTKISALRNLLA